MILVLLINVSLAVLKFILGIYALIAGIVSQHSINLMIAFYVILFLVSGRLDLLLLLLLFAYYIHVTHMSMYELLGMNILNMSQPNVWPLPAGHEEESKDGGDNPKSETPESPAPGSEISTSEKSDTGSKGEDQPDIPISLKSHGNVSLDYRNIGSGWITIFIGEHEFLRINLLWVLSQLSRTARRSLSKALSQKEFHEGMFPLRNSGQIADNANTVAGPALNPDPASGGESPSAGSLEKSIWNNRAFQQFVLKFLKAVGMSNPRIHSSSVFDSLRTWVNRNPSLNLIYQGKNKNGEKISLSFNADRLIEGIVSDLKNKRVTGKGHKIPGTGTPKTRS